MAELAAGAKDDDAFGRAAMSESRATARIAAATAGNEKRRYGGFMMRVTDGVKAGADPRVTPAIANAQALLS